MRLDIGGRGTKARWVMPVALVLLVLSVSPAAATGARELPVPAQAAISAVLGRDDHAYHAVPYGPGVRLSNPRHRLEVVLTPEGVQIQRGSAHWRFVWQGYGYGAPSLPGPPVIPSVHANRVEYRRGAVTEWYVNGPRGLQQGFTLAAPPTPRTEGPLTLALALSGTLQAHQDASGALSLKRADGQAVLAYHGLTAWDATGRTLPARLRLRGAQLHLEVEDAGAQYPLVVDPFVEEARLTASGLLGGEEFGGSVAVDGDTVVVGARRTDLGRGAAYVFVKPACGWASMTQTAKLTASDRTADDEFGTSVAISGDTVVVGAYLDDVGANSNQGSAYVFVRPPGGWTNMTQTAKLTASDGHRSDLFGFSVAMSGDTVVVGAFLAPGDGDQRGAAYVFVKPNPGAWTDMTQTAKLTTPGGTAPPFLGRAVAISGDTVVVGASGGAGAAYIFVKPGAGWTDMTATAQLPLPVQTGDIGGLQNHYLAISGDTVVAGTPFSDVNVGLATVFVKPGGGWGTAPATSATLAASDRTPGDFFGWSVAISGDTVVVGSSQDDVAPGFDHGSAYIFIKPGGGWTGALTESAKLTASVPTPSANFGWSVAIGGATVVVGARGHGEGPGAAYVFGSVAPDARAGAVQSVLEGALVTLDGSASVGSCLNFAWEQLAGPPADLAGDDTATPTFSAPLLPGGFESQTLTFRLTVSNDGGSSSDTVDVTVANVNHAPQAVATGPTEVNEGSAVELSGSASFDPDADPITAYAWEQIGGPTVALTGADTATPSFTAPLLAGGVGSAVALTFQLTVSDGALTDTDTLTVLVEQVNHAPIARAGADQTVAPGAVVTLDGTASEDSDGDLRQFHWVQVGGPAVSLSLASTATPSFTAPAVAAPTALTFRLTVDDAALVSAPDDVVITVVRSNDPPQCDLAQASPRLLWPPNHKMLPVGITGVADPNNDAVSISITGVTQDEPVNGLGDGDTSPDAVLQAHNVLIRAERSGTGTGRVYRISFTAGDGNGGSCAGAVTVTVPHSMKPGSVAIDDGQIYVSTLP